MATNGTGGAGGGTVQCHTSGTFTVTNQGASAYLIDGTANPTLTLCRGSTYFFAISATGASFLHQYCPMYGHRQRIQHRRDRQWH
jgi:hypothetical protein